MRRSSARQTNHGSSTDDDDEEDTQFLFDETSTIVNNNISKTHAPIVDAKKKNQNNSEKNTSSLQQHYSADICNNFEFKTAVENDVDDENKENSHVNNYLKQKFERSYMNKYEKASEKAKICLKLVDLPWKAYFGSDFPKSIWSKNVEKKPKNITIEKIESLEKKRAGSGHKENYQLNSSELINSKKNKEKLAEDQNNQKIPNLNLNSLRDDQQYLTNKPMVNSEDDEVFYKNENDNFPVKYQRRYTQKNYHSSTSPPNDPYGARSEFKINRKIRDPEYYKRKRNNIEVDDLCQRIKSWRRFEKEFDKLKNEDTGKRLLQKLKETDFRLYLDLICSDPIKLKLSENLQKKNRFSFNDNESLPKVYKKKSISPETSPTNISPTNPLLLKNKKLPFINALKKNNQKSHSIHANNQELLYILKQSHPEYFMLAKRLIDKNPKCENLVEDFLIELEKRADRLRKSVQRIQKSLKTAMGERINNLTTELRQVLKRLRNVEVIIEKINGELQTSFTAQHKKHDNQIFPKDVYAIRLLQRVFKSI